MPSFGLNFYNLGGDSFNSGDHTEFLTRYDQATQPSNLIVFTSAWMGTASNARGCFLVTPPTGVQGISFGGNVWNAATINPFAGDGGMWGYVDARCNGKVAVNYMDGHSKFEAPDELRDMQRWSDAAAKAKEDRKSVV